MLKINPSHWDKGCAYELFLIDLSQVEEGPKYINAEL
jgi:hypothetical protein